MGEEVVGDQARLERVVIHADDEALEDVQI